MIPWWGSTRPSDAVPTIAESLMEANRLLEVLAARTAIEVEVATALQRRIEATWRMTGNIAALIERLSYGDTDAAALAALTRNLSSSTDALAAAVAAHKQE